MSPTVHRIYITTLTSIVVATTIYLAYEGFSYYMTPFEERFYHPDHANFKPSGLYGHGLGIIGTLLILIGVFMYIARKRYQFLARFGRLKYWLEFHIFLCSLGPVMVLYHTAFKFGGIVSISFWSMVAVVISGVIGRYIYIQIPRSIEGRELSLNEVKALKVNVGDLLHQKSNLDEGSVNAILTSTEMSDRTTSEQLFTGIIKRYFEDQRTIRTLKKTLKKNQLSRQECKQILTMVKTEISINNRIERLQSMQQLFKYWHVAHLPFAIIMLLIMVIHVGITLAFGYKWIF